MSAYLKRLQLDSVEESTENPSAYLKRVEIVEVEDQDGNPWVPVPPSDPPTIGTVTATIDGAPYDITVGAPVTILSGDSVTLATSISGDASPSYTWTVKSGSASITGTGSTVTALIDTVAPGSVQIQCDIVDTNASDNPFSFRYVFLIGE